MSDHTPTCGPDCPLREPSTCLYDTTYMARDGRPCHQPKGRLEACAELLADALEGMIRLWDRIPGTTKDVVENARAALVAAGRSEE